MTINPSSRADSVFMRKPDMPNGQVATTNSGASVWPSAQAGQRTPENIGLEGDGSLKGPFVVNGSDSDGFVVIGKGTRVTGQIADCAKLEIQGTVEGTIVAEAVVIRGSGMMIGELHAVHAEVHGRFEGRLYVRNVLDIRSTGSVEGELSYGKLAVAMGGHIAGQVVREAVANDIAPVDIVANEPVPPPVPAPVVRISTPVSAEMNGNSHNGLLS
jgi:cytoskeletal protein CcmA (bactofilin family)